MVLLNSQTKQPSKTTMVVGRSKESNRESSRRKISSVGVASSPGLRGEGKGRPGDEASVGEAPSISAASTSVSRP